MHFRDILSHLGYRDACRLLGPPGEALLRKGGEWDIDPYEQVSLDTGRFVMKLGEATVIIEHDPAGAGRLRSMCSACPGMCEHIGAAFSLILEEKVALGLAAPPEDENPLESLDEEELKERAVQERAERAREEKMTLESRDPGTPWTDYLVTSLLSGKTYRVALRGREHGQSYCTCPDFKVNTLGTCKHILAVLEAVSNSFPEEVLAAPYEQQTIAVHIRYAEELELRLLLPGNLDHEVEAVVEPLRDRPITDLQDLVHRIQKIERLGRPVTVYPDAEEYLHTGLAQQRLERLAGEIRGDPQNHPLRKTLLHVELLPYQLDGIAFAVGTGRAVLADDMGLGKTMQGIGVSQLLAREAGISRVLVICPASVKSQWRYEIQRTTDRSLQIVLGTAEERASQYAADVFFTICNYEQVLRDITAIEAARWDLIILDEGQRIKNWEAKTTRTVKSLRSRFALVLSGTPLENRLDELYSVVQFIDDRRLGPAFRFFHRHKVVDEHGRVVGYKKLDDLRRRLQGILLRRTRAMVLKQLPPRSTEVRRVPPTREQADLDAGQRRIISTILAKKYLTEMDLLRVQKALLICRMAADSTFLVDKQPPGHSSKLEELDSLLQELFREEDRKIVLFSEWTTMLDLIEPLVRRQGIEYVRLQGSVPQKKRQGLIHVFQHDPVCKLFMTTNAGATGLNLQAADTVVNVDLPWNPAVLEQRISRVHRMGQHRPVLVYLLVTEQTLEENLLSTLSAKRELALAALDPGSEVDELSMSGGMTELKRRLEVLLGARPQAPLDESRKRAAEREVFVQERKESIARAGGKLLGAAFSFIGELLAAAGEGDETEHKYAAILSECLEKKEDGSLEMTVRFPDDSTLKALARTMSIITAQAGEKR